MRSLWYHPESESYIETFTKEDALRISRQWCDEVTGDARHEAMFRRQHQQKEKHKMGLLGKSKGATKTKFQYKRIPAEKMREQANKKGYAGNSFIKEGVKKFSPGDKGDFEIRVLPPTWDDATSFAFDVYVHYSIGPDSSSYLCAKKMNGDRCACCEERKKAQKAGEDEIAEALEPKMSAAFFLIDRNNEKEGPQLWVAPRWKIFNEILSQAQDSKDKSYLFVDDPEEGYDVEFSVNKKGGYRNYTGVKIARKSTPLSDDDEEKDEWLGYVQENQIPDLLIYHDYDIVAEDLKGGVNVPKKKDDEDEEDEEESPRGKSRPSKKPVKKSRDEDEEDEDDDDDEEEDEKPSRPAKKSSSKKKAKDDEEEPEFDVSALTWEDVHGMKEAVLERLIAQEEIPDEDYAGLKSLKEIADVVCMRLGILSPKMRREDPNKKKPAKKPVKKVEEDEDDDDDSDDEDAEDDEDEDDDDSEDDEDEEEEAPPKKKLGNKLNDLKKKHGKK